MNLKWAREDSNLQAFRHTVLSRARLPIPPLAHAPGRDRILLRFASEYKPATYKKMRQAGIEPATYCFEGNRSIQLSYWRGRFLRREGIEPSTLTLRVSCSAN